MNTLKTIGLLLCLGTFVQISNAQYDVMGYYRSTTAVTVRQHIERQQLRDSINRGSTLRGTTRGSTKPSTSNVVNGASTFQLNGHILPEQFYKTFKGEDKDRREGYTLLRSLWDRYVDTAKKDGFPANDLAYTLEHYLVSNYINYHNYYDKNKTERRTKSNGLKESDSEYNERIKVNITIPVERKIYKQFKGFMANDAGIKKMTNEQKQLFAELLVTMTNMAFVNYSDGIQNNDQNKLRVARDAAKQNLENFFGVPVEKIKITNDGLSFDN